jgi:putative membrane protein
LATSGDRNLAVDRRMLLGYCSVQVEVAGVGRMNANQRMLFPLVRTDRAESLIRRALPEVSWPSQPLLVLPARLHRRYLTLPLEFAVGSTLLILLLPGWCKHSRILIMVVAVRSP